MLDEKASVVRVYGEDDAIVGKCSMCQRRIVNDDEKFWCKETRMINTKCFCGGCLLDLKPITDKVFSAYEIERLKYQNDDIPTFYSIDEATGRIVVE